ncbi:helix-turn-helix domain-containing protein [Flavobacterium collinsii]|uniref:HTH araC/xylS-type domain-containing protein n=1 Tax=Flavobacterium collinsii TaxID=1114861 RepID=A0ABN7EJX6_9FLAO|nr:helix-turn-helix domain-containing protein [Flavobacterium collinsii]CAA9198937.1 hypothetical protein FLACOL7796_02476 [Flavobacterium collinsii]
MIFYKHYNIVLLLLFSTFLSAQNFKKNLVKLSYKELKESFWNNEGNKNEQFEYANTYLNKAKRENNPIERARGAYLISLISVNEVAVKYLDSAILYSKNLDDKKLPSYAYFAKAYILKEQFNYKEAIENFLIAERFAKKRDTDFYYETKFSIAALRSEELGQVNEALDLYKECFAYYKGKRTRTPQYSFSYQLVIFALADAYKALKQCDSATYYNKLGYRESAFTKDHHNNSLFVLNEGANMVMFKKYNVALDSINKAIPKIIFYKDYGNILASYYYLGKSFDGLGKKEKAVENFVKVDSMYKITKRITPEFIEGYPYLIKYYRDIGDKENQLKYLNKYMDINNTLQNNYKELTKKLQKEYDIPNLFLEKENLISSLKNEKNKSYWGLSISLFAFIGASGVSFYQYQLKKKYRIRFNTIMEEKSIRELIEDDDKRLEKIKQSNSPKEDIGISEEIVTEIIAKLISFEKEKGYLTSTITIQTLANNFETNSKYLSKVINTYKSKTFTNYINDLRIEYALESLKEDSKLRKYTIQALALEFGFNSAESFSTAFYKKAGIKPTYFIKELEGTSGAIC